MKTKPIFIAAFALALASVPVFAQASDNKPELVSPATEYPKALGFWANSTIGMGLSFQSWHGNFGWAVTVGGMIYPVYTGEAYDWGYNVEADLMLRLFSSNFWDWLSGDLYIITELGHRGDSLAIYHQTPDTYTPGPYVPSFAAGAGIGYELVLFRHFSIPVQFSYSVKWPTPLSFGPEASGGIRYRF